MLTLCIETASSLCAAALFHSSDPFPSGNGNEARPERGEHRLLATARHDGGRAHAEHLLPLIASLPDGGRPDRILVDCGPGSFTGVRIGLATARGLGLGWGVPVRGFSSLAVLAARYADWRNAMALSHRHDSAAPKLPPSKCWSVLTAGHGEYFVQPFQTHSDGRIEALAPAEALLPEVAVSLIKDEAIAGSTGSALTPPDSGRYWLETSIDIDLIADFPARIPLLDPLPIYVRPPDAQFPIAPVSLEDKCPNSEQLS